MIPVELGLPAFSIALATGLGSGVISVWIFRRLISEEEFRVAYNRLLAHLLEFRLFADEPVLLVRAQWDLLRANAMLLRQLAVPTMLLTIPFALLMLGGEALMGHAALRPGDAAVVTLRYDKLPATFYLVTPAGFQLETPPVKIPSEHEVSWRLRPLRAAAGELQFAVGNTPIRQAMFAGGGLHWILPQSELHFKAPVLISYPVSLVFGVSWLVWFIVGSLAGSMIAIFTDLRRHEA